MRARLAIPLVLLVSGAEAPAEPREVPPVLTLDRALAIARKEQPSIKRAAAQVGAAQAQADKVRAPLLPRLSASGSYERTTSNFAPRPGFIPSGFTGTGTTMIPGPSTATSNYWQLGLNASWLLFDFGTTISQWRAARAQVRSQKDTARANDLDVARDVRDAFFTARATAALVDVSQATLKNELDHLKQIQAFVDAGTRAEIDLVRQRTSVANARLALIRAQNQYATARANLTTAMGLEGSYDYEVARDRLGPVRGEDGSLESLVAVAIRNRPELAALRSQRKASRFQIEAARGSYFPSISATGQVTDVGTALDGLTWNFSGGVSLTWTLFAGGSTHASVSAARFDAARVDAETQGERLQVQLQVEQARLAVRAAKAQIKTSTEAADNARRLLQLADGRYREGVGNIIELSDAQLALRNAQAEVIRSAYTLARARSQLLRALGRTR